MPAGELTRRVAVAAVGIPLAAFLVFLGGWWLAVAMAGVAALATGELFLLARKKGVLPFQGLGLVASAFLVLVAGAARSYGVAAPWALGTLVGLFLLSAVVSVFTRWPGGRPLSAVAVTVTGAAYGGGCLSFALFLRHLPETEGGFPGDPVLQGCLLLAFPLVITWAGDTAAYFIGTRFGRRKLLAAVSPAKTVEGGVAGLMAAAVVGAGMGGWGLVLHGNPVISALLGLLFGLVLGVGAQVGDLAESVFKREAGVKDSGALLPGHGGILDRFDALLVTIPLAFLLVLLARMVP